MIILESGPAPLSSSLHSLRLRQFSMALSLSHCGSMSSFTVFPIDSAFFFRGGSYIPYFPGYNPNHFSLFINRKFRLRVVVVETQDKNLVSSLCYGNLDSRTQERKCDNIRKLE